MSFETLGLAPEFVRVVADEGYTEPTPVQREAIPLVLAGRDLLAGAQTGTGKTAAFVLPLLQRLHEIEPRVVGPGADASAGSRASRRPVRALVLVPTRELALQVEESVRTYGRHRPVRSVAIYGGVGFEPQVRALRAGPSIVVATPGRLLDHMTRGTLDLTSVEVLVLDEADRMLDMGFIRDIRRIIAVLPSRRQNLLFSATFSDEIRSLAGGLLDQPAIVDVAPRNLAAELVEQSVIAVDRERKRELLSHLVRSGRIGQALVFTRTKHGANRLADQLKRDGIGAAAIHGNKSQGQRVRALDDLKAGRVHILVATDLAARGLDIDALPHVVNYELPMVASDYVHRIGRTGRAGVGGEAVSLVCIDEAGLLRDIERLLRRTIPAEVMAGFEPDRSIRPEPIRLRSGASARPMAVRTAGRPTVARQVPGRIAASRGRHPERTAPGTHARPSHGHHESRTDLPLRPGSMPAPRHAARGSGRPSARQETGPAHHALVPLPGERLSRSLTSTGVDRAGTARRGGGN